jgi:predicted lipoprotein with Yx(FWY)xxD motif
MRNRLPILGLLISFAILLAACGSNPSTGGGASPAPKAVAIHVASNTPLGSYLTTAMARTLYYFAPERDSHPSAPNIMCSGSCAKTWPPLLAPSALLTVNVALPGTLKTIVRPDGGRQVTYSDWPLYTFSGDNKPGDTNGQGLMGYWFVASTGLTEAVATPAPTPAPAPVPSQPRLRCHLNLCQPAASLVSMVATTTPTTMVDGMTATAASK